jgi:hypothetical protein
LNVPQFRLCNTYPGGLRQLLAYDGLSNRHERYGGEFEVLPRKRNADNGDRTSARGKDMQQCEPPTGKQEPNDVAKKAKTPSANIPLTTQFRPTNQFAPERQKSEFCNHEAGARPWNPDNGKNHGDPKEKPNNGHDDPAA